MKRLIYTPLSEEDHNTIEAMSLINPQLCRQLGLKISVMQGGEGPIPHVHVYRGSDFDSGDCTYIRLDKPEYSQHHNKPVIELSKKEKEAFIQIMKSKWPKYYHESADGSVRKATGYEAAVDTWVDTYEDGDYSKFQLDMNGDPIMPDYSFL